MPDTTATEPPTPRRQALDAQGDLCRSLGLFIRTHYRDFSELLAIIETADGTPARLAFLDAIVRAAMEHATDQATTAAEVTSAYEVAESAAFTGRTIRLAIVRHRLIRNEEASHERA
jgi:hypothetical protein